MALVNINTSTNSHPEYVGRFRIKELLGTGSMGAVYLVEDPVIHRQVAIKTLSLNRSSKDVRLFEENFLNEARAAGRLNHPHIVTVYDAGRIDGTSYIAMEYLKGTELKEQIARGEAFSMRQIAEIMIRVANALNYAHQHGIVHRDIKPANIFMVNRSNPKILDFGIAQAASSASGKTINPFKQKIVGTPNYMAPELIQGKVIDGRADIFSLGVVLYEMLTSQLPFKGKTFEELTNSIINSHPIPPQELNADVPLRIAKVVAKALAKNPAERYQTAKEFSDDLRRYVASVRMKKIISASSSLSEAELRAHRRSKREAAKKKTGREWLIAAAAVLLSVGGIAAYFYEPVSTDVQARNASQQFLPVVVSRPPTKPVLPSPAPEAPTTMAAMNAPTAPRSSVITAPVDSAPASRDKPALETKPPRERSGIIEQSEEPSGIIRQPQERSGIIRQPEERSGVIRESAERSGIIRQPEQNNFVQQKEPPRRGSKVDRNKPAPESAMVAPPEAPSGSLSIAVSPWGEVFIDGTSRGIFPPLTTLSLPAGKHAIEIRNGASEPIRKTIEIQPDDMVRIYHRF